MIGHRLIDYDYDLPVERIAQEPVSPRDASRLLISQQQGISSTFFSQISSHLRAGDALVLNNTKVLPARLLGKKSTGGQVEILLLRPLAGQTDALTWTAMMRANKPIRIGLELEIAADFSLKVVDHVGELFHVWLHVAAGTLEQAIEQYGHIPLPPYIASSGAAQDRHQYQTVFACHPGAVAAPTAGLHFTQTLLDQLAQIKVQQVLVTLHVGMGTFQPVRCADVRQHHIHQEWCCLNAESAQRLNDIRARGGKIVAVGTTAARVLESAVDTEGIFHPFQGETALFILPGYQFHGVDRLITNFHLPKSTLLMLVAAFIGEDRLVRDYAYAIAQGYRFYSYGDASLLYPK